MPINIYNSLTRKKDPFEPLNPEEIKMYVCGPTVYDQAHIGHARSAYIFDLIRRYLVYRGYRIKFVRNVTDVDDKIIDKAKKEFPGEDLNSAAEKTATKYLNAYHEDMRSLGIADPDFEPRATEYISREKPLMQKFIQLLIERKAAYVSGKDVYFDIKKAKDYGKLSGQSLDKMEIGARILPGENKRDPLDFVLWKSAKKDEPCWESPWGKGRPGWHVECSVMSLEILGDEFDIHGGGLDLIFPHHENEIAQSEGAGKKFARVWVHHGLLTINGQKMAKSLGNFVTVKDFIAKYKYADLLKLFFLSAHYSHPIDYIEEKIEEARKAYERINILIDKIEKAFGTLDLNEIITSGTGFMQPFKDKFVEYMDDDFNTPRALSVIFDLVNKCNILLDSDDEFKNFKLRYASDNIKEMVGVLGLSFFKAQTVGISDAEINRKIKMRLDYKKQGKYQDADGIRKELEKEGVILEDNKSGSTTWHRKI